MTSQREKRRKAYKYILNQVKKLNLDLLCKSDKTIANVSYIPLSDIEKVKEGIADPSEELVEALEGLFHHIASEAETEDHLVKPFSNQYGRT